MIYGQIKNSKIVNIIVLEDLSQIEALSEGYDALVRVDDKDPAPQIGWTMFPDQTFQPPASDI